MSYTSTLGQNNEFELPDDICKLLDVSVGDVLIFEVSAGTLIAKKFENQSLTDEEITKANNLSRVIELS